MIVVQHIVTEWTKASRGGEGARRRNQVPEGLPVPRALWDGKAIPLLRQDVWFLETLDFAPHEKVAILDADKPTAIGCVTVRPDGEGAQAVYRYDYVCAGAPDRGRARKTISLMPGQWARLVWNGRFIYDDSGRWFYRKHVVNVGAFDAMKSGMFLRSEPIHSFSLLEHLF